MLPNKIEKAAVAALEDIKASHITLLDTRPLTAMYDSIIVATAESARQTKALARHVRDKVIEAGGQVLSIEGENTGEWVLVDCTELVVHIMLPTTRALYNLEELWTAPTSARRAKAVAEPTAAVATVTAATRAPARAGKGKAPLLTKTAERKAARASKASTQAAVVEEAPAPVVKKTTAAKKPAVKAVAAEATVKKPAVKKAATKTAAVKKPAAKKPAAKAPAAKKVVAKKPAAISAAPAPKMTPIKRPSTKKAR